MSDSNAEEFVDAIIANPQDDTLRYIFADWLDDNGDPHRAEFIRTQIERESLPSWDPRRLQLRVRERVLLDAYEKAWKRELPQIKGVSWGEFRRGLIGSATFASLETFRTNARRWQTAAPIEAVSVPAPQRHESIASMPAIPGLRELSIISTLVDQREIAEFANSAVLSTVATLTVGDCSLGGIGISQLLASPHLTNLKTLRIPFNSIGNSGVHALHQAKSLEALEELNLSETGSYGRYGEDPIIDEHGARRLAEWPGLSKLNSLTLSGNEIRQQGLRALLQSPGITGLKELIVRANNLGPAALDEFATAAVGLQLDVLDLGDNILGHQHLPSLASAPCLRDLKVLVLDRCEIRHEQSSRFASAPFFATLRRLNVNHNYFLEDGLKSILEQSPRHLHTLQIADNELGENGALLLANSPVSETLLALDLSKNGLGDRAMQALVDSKYLGNLLILRLLNNPISKNAAISLATSELGQQLTHSVPIDEDDYYAAADYASAGDDDIPSDDDDIPW